MLDAAPEQDEISSRVSPIVEDFLQTDHRFETLDRDRTIERLTHLIQTHFSIEEFRTIADDDLEERLWGVMGIELISDRIDEWIPSSQQN